MVRAFYSKDCGIRHSIALFNYREKKLKKKFIYKVVKTQVGSHGLGVLLQIP